MDVHFRTVGAWAAAAFVFLLAGFIPLRAHAGDGRDTCNALGVFDRKAKQKCLDALNAAQGAKGATGQAVRAVGGNPSGESQPPYVSPSPVAAGYSRQKVFGNVFTDIQGIYPEGYGPQYAITKTRLSVPVTFEPGLLQRTLDNSEDYGLTTDAGDGRALFVFHSAINQICIADLTTYTDPVVLNDRPRHFVLSNFHVHGTDDKPCQAMSLYERSWGGTIDLSSDIFGNISMDIALSAFKDDGRRSFTYHVKSYAIPNVMTPQVAAADLNQKNQAAAAAAAQAQADADQQKADATDVAAAKTSALKGDVIAQWLLGGYYRLGSKGVNQDDAESFKWYQMAANQENVKYNYEGIIDIVADAQYWIGRYYETGTGIPKNLKNSVLWYKKCASRNEPACQVYYAEAYADGNGVIPDYVEALTWCLIALANPRSDSDDTSVSEYTRDRSTAIRNLASDLKDELEPKMNGAQIAEAQGRARTWWATH